MVLKIIVLTLYAGLIVRIGLAGLRRTRTFADFFLGGGKVGPLMTAFTYGTAYFSAVLFIGFAGKIGWSFGLSGLWIALGNSLIGVLGVWLFLAPRVHDMSRSYGVATMAEFLEKRFKSRFLRFFAGSAVFVFFIPYTAAVFIGLSYLFLTTFGIPYEAALIFMGLFTALYLTMGGYRSMVMIDVVFGMVMTGGVLLLLYGALSKGGGLAAILAGLRAVNPDLAAAVGPPGLWPLFSLVFLTSIAPFAMPQLVQKFYAIRDRKAIRLGMIASTAFAVLVTGTAYFIGATTRVFLTPEGTPRAFPGGTPDFDALIPELFLRIVPEGLLVIIMLLLLSASMSTLAALVLMAGSALARDIYAGFVKPDISDRGLTLMMRVLMAVFVLISVLLAFVRPATIVSILAISWGAIGATFLGPFIWGLFWKGTTRAGAVAGSIGALAVTLGLFLSAYPPPEAGTIGMLVSLALTPLISLAGRRRGQASFDSDEKAPALSRDVI